MKKVIAVLLVSLVSLSSIFTNAQQQHSADDVAKKLANPVANLINVPLQFNYQFNINGKYVHENGYKMLLNIQPVIPVHLGKGINLVSRVIIPVIAQKDVLGYNSKETGMGDILYTAFISPSGNKIIWGIGPVFSIPTATNELLGTKKLSIGPSGVILVQPGKWTIGALVNQLWSVAGSSSRSDVNAGFVQPFISYVVGGGFTVGVSSENEYDWKNKMLVSGLAAANISQVFKFGGKQPASISLSPVIYYANSSVQKPEWGIRSSFTLIFSE